MSNLEHYFENLLYHGEDVYGGINKQSLTSDVQDAVEVCAQYVIYSLFGNRKAFEKFIKDASAADVVEVVRCENCHYGFRYFDVQNGDMDSWVDCTNPDGLNRDVSNDGYCSAGIRRKDEC